MKTLIVALIFFGFELSSLSSAQNARAQESTFFKSSWNIGFNAGLNWHIAEGNFPNNDHMIFLSPEKNAGVMLNATVGYDLSSVVSLRARLGFVEHNWPDIRYSSNSLPVKIVKYNSENISVDFVVNINQWLDGDNARRKFEISTFAGIGLEHRDKASFNNEWYGAICRVGGQGSVKISSKIDFVIIFEVNMVGDNYNEYVRSFPLEGYPALTFGLNFK